MTDEYMAEGLSASERAELVLFGMERGSHRPDGEEKDLYAITKASLVRAIEAAERDARASAAATPVPNGRAKVIQLLWEKQFEGSPWHSKFHLIRPDSLEKDYGALADTIIAALASPHSRPARTSADDCSCVGAVIGSHDSSCPYAVSRPNHRQEGS